MNHLITLFDQSIDKYPDRTALVDDTISLTYTSFYNATCHAALQIAEYDLLPNELIGVCMDRSVSMVIGIFSILRTGSAYVPVNPTHPVSAIQEMYTDASVRYVLTSPDMVDHLSVIGLIPIVIEIDTTPCNYVSPALSPDDSAYVIFTSGSTGLPKGVVVPHRPVTNLIEYKQRAFPLKEGDVVLFRTPVTFDSSVWELFGWFLFGGTLAIGESGVEMNPATLYRSIVKYRVAFFFCVPSMLKVFLDYVDPAQAAKIQTSLKWLSVGGEELIPELVKKFYSRFDYSSSRLINEYGPTEATVFATAHICSPENNYTKVPIGRPIDGCEIFLLDENRCSVPIGETGEIGIGGAGLAKGYLRNSDLTAEKFVKSDLSVDGRIYRTGDIGRQLENGEFEFIGRVDFQVKLRGIRIELGEVERYVRKIDGILDVVVVSYVKPNSGKALSAFIRVDPLKILSDFQVKKALYEIIPMYMMPEIIQIVSDFPLTPHGKVNRIALEEMANTISRQERIRIKEIEQQFSKFDTQEGLSECEFTILKTVHELGGDDSIGIDDNLLLSGFDSMSIVGLIVSLDRDLDVRITISDVYHHPTVRDLAAIVSKTTHTGKSKEIICLQKGDPHETPIFFLWGAGQIVFQMTEMVKYLGPNIPIYVIQAPIVDGKLKMPKSLIDLARHYVDELQKVVLGGKVHLAGYSFGGFVVYEMERLMRNSAIRVDQLFVIDMTTMYSKYEGQSWFDYKTSMIRSKIAWFIRSDAKSKYTMMETNLKTFFVICKVRTSTLFRPKVATIAEENSVNGELQQMASKFLHRYLLTPSEISIKLLVSNSYVKFGGEKLGWSRFALKGVDAKRIYAYHADLFYGENMERIANWLKLYLPK